jgi:hypothetical protein
MKGKTMEVRLYHPHYGFLKLQELWVHENGTRYGVFEVDYMGLGVSLPLSEVIIDRP